MAKITKEYIIKGWVIDDEKLKKGTYLTDKYFEEQLEKLGKYKPVRENFIKK